MITKEQFIKNVNSKNPKAGNIEIIGEYTRSDNSIECKCKIDEYTWNPIAFSLYKSGCPVCTNRVIVRGINDLWTTHPHIAKLLTNQNEGYEIVAGTHPITKEQLHWRQVTDDDIISSYDLNNLKEKMVYA